MTRESYSRTVARAVRDAVARNRAETDTPVVTRIGKDGDGFATWEIALQDPKPRKRTRTPKPRQRVDVTALVAGFGPQRPHVTSVPSPGRDLEAVALFHDRDGQTVGATPVDLPGRADRMFMAPGRPPLWDIEKMVEKFRGLGVEFALAADGSLVAITEQGRMSPELAAAIVATEKLIRAYKAGTPLTCVDCGDEAVTLLFPGNAPVCAEHAGEELPDGA